MNAVETSVMQNAAQGELQRQQKMARAWRYFYGEHDRIFKPKPNQPDDNLPVNLCKLVVLKGVAYLYGKGENAISWDAGEGSDSGEPTREEAYLESVWGPGKMLRLKQYAQNGGVTGHPFLRIRLEPKPRLIVLDPGTVTPSWESDDYEKVWRYKIQQTGLSREAKLVVHRQLIELEDNEASWVIRDQVSSDGGGFVTMAEEVWPHPFAPIVHNQNLPNSNEFWGLGDLESDVLALNKGVDSVLSNLQKIVRLFAHPRPWVKGLVNIPEPSANPTDVFQMPEGAETGAWQLSADVAGVISFLSELRQFFHEITRMPEVATGRVQDIGALSGVAIRILYEPLIELTEDKRGTYGEALVDLNRRLLVLGGFARTLDEAPDVQLHWPDVLPSDPFGERQAALIDEQLGVSRDTLLRRLGYDPDDEAAKADTSTAALGTALVRNFEQGGQ